MRAQPFLILIVLGVAFIGVVALLNWTPHTAVGLFDGKSDGGSGLCEGGWTTPANQGEYPLRQSAGDAHVVKQIPLQPCATIRIHNNPDHGESCVYVSVTGEGNWFKVPYAPALAVPYVIAQTGIYQEESAVDYNHAVRWWDDYYVTADEPILMDVFGIAKGAGFSCPTDYRR